MTGEYNNFSILILTFDTLFGRASTIEPHMTLIVGGADKHNTTIWLKSYNTIRQSSFFLLSCLSPRWSLSQLGT